MLSWLLEDEKSSEGDALLDRMAALRQGLEASVGYEPVCFDAARGATRFWRKEILLPLHIVCNVTAKIMLIISEKGSQMLK